MSKNEAVVFVEPRKVILEEIEIPSPRQNELLIKTEYTLISTGTDLTILSGEYPRNSVWSRLAKFPSIKGCSNVGEVIAVGDNADRAWIGRQVVSQSYHATFVVSSVEHVVAVSQSVSKEDATFFLLCRTVMNGLRRARIEWGEAAVIYGLGILGQFATRLCWLAGMRPVIGVDLAEFRLGKLPSKSGVIGINAQREDVVSRVDGATRGRMADVVFEVTGSADIIPDEFCVLREQGRFVVLSSPRGFTNFDFHDLCNRPSFTIVGAHANSHPLFSTPDNPWTKARHTELFFDLVARGDLDVGSLITHRMSYKKAPEAYNDLLEDRSKALGVVLEW